MARILNREANSALRSRLVGARGACLPIASTSCAGPITTAKRNFTLSALDSRHHALHLRKSDRLTPQMPLVRSASDHTLQAATSTTSARYDGRESRPTIERRSVHTSRENIPQGSSERRSELEHQLMNLPLVQELLGSQTSSGVGSQHSSTRFIATRPYDTFPPSKLETHMTAGQLRGPGRFAISPLALIRAGFGQSSSGAESEAESPPGDGEADAHVIYHLGRFLCGHEGIIHGGLLATICDEALAVIGFRHFQSKVGVTVRLEIDYRSPAVPDHFVGVQVRLVRDQSSPRKAVVVGTMRDLQTDKVLVDAKAIFVEPRDARLNASLAGSPNASRP